MYDPAVVLAALDANQWRVIALCGFAMLCNYTWFIAAVRRGLRDRVVPIPVFCVLFWLAGDASMVLRSARTLHWQTQKPVRLVGPDGVVPLDADSDLSTPATRG